MIYRLTTKKVLNDFGKMGRDYINRKTTVEECKDIDVFWLNKNGYFQGMRTGGIEWSRGFSRNKSSVGFTVNVLREPYIHFRYTITDRDTRETQKMDYQIALTTTPCHFGGKRYWFICPLGYKGTPCRRRVAKLFLDDFSYFGCRHCLQLSYDSRNKNHRSPYVALMQTLEAGKRIEKLQKEMKITHRKGKPTKKYVELMQLVNIYNDQRLIQANQELMKALYA